MVTWRIAPLNCSSCDCLRPQVMDNRMIDLQVSNNKLYFRAIGIVAEFAKVGKVLIHDKHIYACCSLASFASVSNTNGTNPPLLMLPSAMRRLQRWHFFAPSTKQMRSPRRCVVFSMKCDHQSVHALMHSPRPHSHTCSVDPRPADFSTHCSGSHHSSKRNTGGAPGSASRR